MSLKLRTWQKLFARRQDFSTSECPHSDFEDAPWMADEEDSWDVAGEAMKFPGDVHEDCKDILGNNATLNKHPIHNTTK